MASDSKKILIVEDDDNIASILDDALKKEGYVTELAQAAEEAMNKLNTFQPHLVLTDHEMPGFTGLEMLKELRQRDNYVNVVFVSGKSETSFVVDVFKAGADDYIKKPFRIPELLVRIESSLKNNDVHRELYKANAKLQELIDRDYLTGLFNMRSMYEKIEFEIKRARRFNRNIACIMLDMDNFKTVNDDNDHLFGSYVIQEMGKIIKDTIREVDYGSRYGGDEFLIVLTETDQTGVEVVCERLRKIVEETTFSEGENKIELTLSLGYAINRGGGVDAKTLVREADHALYKSKEGGRNRFTGSVIETPES